MYAHKYTTARTQKELLSTGYTNNACPSGVGVIGSGRGEYLYYRHYVYLTMYFLKYLACHYLNYFKQIINHDMFL
jgi:hypothetical protein